MNYRSVYHNNAGYVSLNIEDDVLADEWDAILTLDPNSWHWNEFGDGTSSTKMALERIPAHATRLRLADPMGWDRRCYALSSGERRLGNVVVDPAVSYLLLVEEEKGGATLFPVRHPVVAS